MSERKKSGFCSKTFFYYLRCGLTPSTVRGIDQKRNLWPHMYAFNHDGVQYAIDDSGDLEKDNCPDYINLTVEVLSTVIDRHHQIIKNIQNYIKKQYKVSNVWCAVLPAPHMQIRFGVVDHYVGTVSLDFMNDSSRFMFEDEIRQQIIENEDIDPSEIDMIQICFDNDFKFQPETEEDYELLKELESVVPEIEVIEPDTDIDEDEDDGDDEDY